MSDSAMELVRKWRDDARDGGLTGDAKLINDANAAELEDWAKQMDNVVDENRQTDDWGVQIVDVDIIRRDILGTLEGK